MYKMRPYYCNNLPTVRAMQGRTDRKRHVFALLALLLCLLAVPASAATLRLAVGLPKPPYVEAGGQGGLEAALAIAVLAQAGYQAKVVQVPQARGLAMLKEGQVEAMITLIPGASEGVFYSQPLIYYRNRAITLQGSGISLNHINDLSRHTVASFQNARLLFGSDFATAVARSPGYSEHADQDTLNRLLLNRRVDVVISDEYIFRANPTQTDLNGVRYNIVSFALFGNSPRHVGFVSHELRQQFDAALLKLKASGEYERINQYYRQRYRLPTTP